MLDSLTRSVNDAVNNGNYGVAAIVTAIIILFSICTNSEKIINAFQSLKVAQKETLSKSISDIDEEQIKNFIKNKITEDIFYIATGLKADFMLIKKLVEFYNQYEGEYTFKYIQKASQYMKIQNNQLKINISCSDTIEYWLNILASILICLIGLIIMIAIAPIQDSIGKILYLTIFSLCIIIFGIFILTLTFPYKAAKTIKKDIDNTLSSTNSNNDINNEQTSKN